MSLLRGFARAFRRPPDAYELLPRDDPDLRLLRVATGATSNGRRCAQVSNIRRLLLLLVIIPFGFLCAILWSGVPPLYTYYWQYERSLPQQNLSLAPPEGRNGSYVRFYDSIWGHGWNNFLQERILLSHLAFLSNRSYVFEPYTWSQSPFPYTISDFALRPSRIPLNAIISGPSAGGGSILPRAVSSEWWETVCPKEKRLVLDSGAVNEEILESAEGSEIMKKWVDALTDADNGCVEVENDSRRPFFDWNFLGSPRFVSIWHTVSGSPILKSFAWSRIVTSAVVSNLPLLNSTQSLTLPSALPGLIALHVRRGDYVRHCPRLFTHSAHFTGYNNLPTLPQSSHFDPPSIDSTDERLAYYTRRCWPSYDDIARRLAEVRHEWEVHKLGRKLERIFVLTNGGKFWSYGLKERLTKEGWFPDNIKVTSDLSLGREARYVDFAVDMAIAERAEVFIGNGFSSLTSNVIMLRMAREADPESNHLW